MHVLHAVINQRSSFVIEVVILNFSVMRAEQAQPRGSITLQGREGDFRAAQGLLVSRTESTRTLRGRRLSMNREPAGFYLNARARQRTDSIDSISWICATSIAIGWPSAGSFRMLVNLAFQTNSSAL